MTPPDFFPQYVATRAGLMHVVSTGDGPPVLLLHQAPGSWDEFLSVMPLLTGRRALAVDLIGFGCSQQIDDHSIPRYADSVLALLDALDLHDVDVVGHKLGGIVAVEASAMDPSRLRRLVLSGAPYVDEVYRRQRSALHPLSLVEQQDDGRHLNELWVRRSGFYPPARPDLLNRFVRDVLWLGDQAEEAHNAISAYRMEGRTTFPGPVLCLAATADPWYEEVKRLADQLPNARLTSVCGGTVPLMEHMPREIAALVNSFLDE